MLISKVKPKRYLLLRYNSSNIYDKMRDLKNSITEKAIPDTSLLISNVKTQVEKAIPDTSLLVSNVKTQVEKVYDPINNQIKFMKRISMLLVVLMTIFLIIYAADKITDICIKIKKIRNE